eukprot:TRINITY_DN7699_c0_g1_i6.p1 TRINITY_DN7699_c0_g1~~TRINITY_DN7699_c0_g1_i6.p1  ORF type:complete len:1022 (-),score=122.62 TRINITY_DN7699_c0_g1_i6:346-3231(-)
MAVLYLENPLPVIGILHNAEYQGVIGQQLLKLHFKKLGEIFNVAADRLEKDICVDGQFNMLKPLVQYVLRHQRGYGIAAVSKNYALEAQQKHNVLWPLPEVRGIENCMIESERGPMLKQILKEMAESGNDDFIARKLKAKASQQKEFKLNVDPSAKMFVFLGRWVKQKGMDYIADVTEWMMKTHPKAQLLMIGPPGDCYGRYSAAKLNRLAAGGQYDGRLFVAAKFMSVSEELKLACDFCLMPSRDEPFGYVDIEFGWYGALTVGAFRGGLGKIPGFYYQISNGDSSANMRSALKMAISAAMTCEQRVVDGMIAEARKSSFPQSQWQHEMCDLYEIAMNSFTPGESHLSLGTERKTRRRETQRVSTIQSNFSKRISQRRSESLAMTAIESMHTARRSVATRRTNAEFLRQDVTDDDLQEYLDRHLKDPSERNFTCDQIMKLCNLECERDKVEDGTIRYLMREWHGMVLFDISTCAAFVSGPLVSAVFTKKLLPQCTTSEFDLALSLTKVFSCILWTMLSRYIQPNLLMSFAALSRLLPLLVAYLGASEWAVGLCIGLVSAGDLVFLYFNFMCIIVEDIARLSFQMGILITISRAFSFVPEFLYYIPDGLSYAFQCVCAVLFVLMPALVALKAPPCYRQSNMPDWQFGFLRYSLLGSRGRVLLCFLGWSFATSLASNSNTFMLTWRKSLDRFQGYEDPYNMRYTMATVTTPCLGLVFFGLVLWKFPDYTMPLLRAFSCFMLPTAALRLLVMYILQSRTDAANLFDAMALVSYLAEAMQTISFNIASVAVLGNRWRFVAYFCVSSLVISGGNAISTVLFGGVVGDRCSRLTEDAASLGDVAYKTFLVALAPYVLAFLVCAPAYFLFDREAVPTLLSSRAARMMALMVPLKPENPVLADDKLETDKRTSTQFVESITQDEVFEFSNSAVVPSAPIQAQPPATTLGGAGFIRCFGRSSSVKPSSR